MEIQMYAKQVFAALDLTRKIGGDEVEIIEEGLRLYSETIKKERNQKMIDAINKVPNNEFDKRDARIIITTS